jgi:hypothetical protein
MSRLAEIQRRAVESHWETENFNTWSNTVEPMFDCEPETVSTMRTIFPRVGGMQKQKVTFSNW